MRPARMATARAALLLGGGVALALGWSLPAGGAFAADAIRADRAPLIAQTETKPEAYPKRHRGVQRSGLPLPRFASLRARKVNLRAGPGVRYPVEWVYQRRGLPVMITAEFDAWRKIKDWRGTEGWVHRAMLTGKRTVITIAREVVLRRKPAKDAPAVARAEGGVIARVLSCAGAWCRIEAGGFRGWGRRRALWGTLKGETIE